MAYGRPPRWHRSDFGKRLVAARLRLGLSQTQVASKIGISQQAYAGWERRTMAIKPQHIARLVEVLGIGFDELLGTKGAASRPEAFAGRAYDVFMELGKLPPREQKRLIEVIEDLISAARRKRQ